MAEQIRDGAGGRHLQRVDKNFRAHTFSITEPELVDANRQGDAYNVNTGFITLTDAVDTPVIYLKNNEDKQIVIEAIVVGLFNSTGGSSTADVYATFIRNPTAGTIISGATNVDINSNRNFGSANTLLADTYKGATGDTMTDGMDHILVRASANSRSFVGISEILPKGTTIGVKIKPPTSNTSMVCYVALILYLEQDIV